MGKRVKGGQIEKTTAAQTATAPAAQPAEAAAAQTATAPAAKQTLKEDIAVRSIKMLDIGYTTVLFGIPSLFMAAFLNKHVYAKIQIGDISKDEDKTTWSILFETLLCLTINGIVAYILRNLLQLIPFPLEGIYGFKHMNVMEVRSGMIVTMFLLWMSPVLLNKFKVLQQRFSKFF
jgi:prolipoprotein diacylglyceryltransferase